MGEIQDIQNDSPEPKKERESIQEYLHRIGDDTSLSEREIDDLATAIERDRYAKSYTWSESDTELLQRLRRDLRQSADEESDTQEQIAEDQQKTDSTSIITDNNPSLDTTRKRTETTIQPNSDVSSAGGDLEKPTDTPGGSTKANKSKYFVNFSTFRNRNFASGFDYRPSSPGAKFLAFAGVVAAIEMIFYVGVTSRLFEDFWFFYDAREVWRPNAEAVLSSDTGLYQSPATDNKPPLWQYLNLAVYASGYYATVMFSLVAAANSVSAFLIFQYVSGLRGRSEIEGMLAGSMYLFAVPAIGGLLVNVRSFAIVGLLIAINTRRGWISGLALSAGGLFSQFAMLAAPVLVAREYRRRDSGFTRWFIEFVVAGCGLAVLSFLPLLYWGVTSVENAIESSILYSDEYVLEHSVRNPLIDPWAWVEKLHDVVRRIYWLLVPTLLMLFARLRGVSSDDVEGTSVVAVLCVLFLSTLFIKSLTYYWLFPAVFMSILTSRGVVMLAESQVKPNNSTDEYSS